MVSANFLADMKFQFKYNNTDHSTKKSASKNFFETILQSIILGIIQHTKGQIDESI
jgi:hypothetical protein